jgi:5-methylthioadenosine/S-adenosylhomocysteine deaminase
VIDSGMTPVWNPSASMYLGVGANFRGRHSELHHAGVPLALACDSANSSGRFDLADQGYLAVISAREKTGNLALYPEDALDMMTRNGAQAVGMADRIGSLEVGKRADLVIHRNDLPEAHPGLDRIRQLVFSTRAASVAHVIVDGRVIVENGRSTMVDEAEVYARADEAARRVIDRLGGRADDRWPVI